MFRDTGEELPDDLMEYASQYYEAAQNLSFTEWLELMTPIWETQMDRMRLEGWLNAQNRPED